MIDPGLVDLVLGAHHHFVAGGSGLVHDTEADRQNAQIRPAIRFLRRQQSALWPCDLVEVVQDGAAFEQHFAVVEDERGNPADRVDLAHVLEIVPRGQRPALERHSQDIQADRDAAGVRGKVSTNQDHGVLPFSDAYSMAVPSMSASRSRLAMPVMRLLRFAIATA